MNGSVRANPWRYTLSASSPERFSSRYFPAWATSYAPKHSPVSSVPPPSIAIATLLITYVTKGATVVVTEARSMVIGGAALAAYSFATCKLIKRYELTGLQATLLAAVVWFGVAFGLAWVLLGTS